MSSDDNIRLESTSDSDEQVAEALFQPEIVHEQTLTVIEPGKRLPWGGTEHSEPTIKVSSQVLPGRELHQDMLTFARRASEFQQETADFSQIVGDSTAQIPEAARREILRAPNGPQITYALAHYPSLTSELCNMSPIAAARRVRELSAELESGDLGEIPYGEYCELRKSQSQHRRRR